VSRETVDNLQDTAPGPDGLRYSAWHNAPQGIKDEQYNEYNKLLNDDNHILVPNHNHALLLPPPEGNNDNNDEYLRVLRNTLSNTDNKTQSGLLSIPATQIAETTIHHDQQIISGRQMGDNFLDIEAKAIQFALTSTIVAGIFAFDISAAFPSLARA
jgi:hypothetical protein